MAGQSDSVQHSPSGEAQQTLAFLDIFNGLNEGKRVNQIGKRDKRK